MRSLILILLVLFSSFPLQAKETGQVGDVALVNSEKDLLLYFTVHNAFTPEMENGIKNGIPVTFTFLVKLFQVNNGSLDGEMLSSSFDHTLQYDSLKQEYRVDMEENGVTSVAVADLGEAKALMSEIHDFKLADLALLTEGRKYGVKVKAKLAKKKLPLNFQYIIPFWQLWKFETDWNTVTFTYGSPGQSKTR
ncbi:MAG: DUF4390 domain-containing protein [Desulfobulbaceae bacterium]|nr:DUF4390 domain-containing protein [Desulfobulbaceae bacterium]